MGRGKEKMKLKCSNCGSELREDAKFCGKCGTVVTPWESDPVTTTKPLPPVTSAYRINQEETKRRKQKNMIIILLTCLVVFVLVDVIVLFGFMKKKEQKNDTTETSVSTEQITEKEDEEESSESTEIVRKDPVFTRANCSSIRNTDSEAGQYSVGAVIDGDIQTKWAPRNANRGLGEWIEIIADEPQYVTGMQIANGYPRDQLTWQRNNRVKDCTISFGDGTYLNVTLLDQKDLQTVNFGREVETNSIRITINSIYYGTKWKDVAIAEIIPFNENSK